MLEDSYRKEMEGIHASEALIADTLKKMQAEQAKLPLAEQPDLEPLDGLKVVEGAVAHLPAKPRSSRTRRPLLLLVGLPAAACLLLAFLGVTFFFQTPEGPGQNPQQSYVFQLVEGTTTLSGGLQFGSIDGQPGGAASVLRRAECPEALLPAGILEAVPVSLGACSVYLGFDKQQDTYYAAYQEEPSSATWTLLQAADLSEAAFVQALEDYLA